MVSRAASMEWVERLGKNKGKDSYVSLALTNDL